MSMRNSQTPGKAQRTDRPNDRAFEERKAFQQRVRARQRRTGERYQLAFRRQHDEEVRMGAAIAGSQDGPALTVDTLDLLFPSLSSMVRSVLGLTLEQLAAREPATNYKFFDLERLLAHRKVIDAIKLDEIGEAIVRLHHQQVRGYIATLEAFVALGVLRDHDAFVTKKLLAPRTALKLPPSSEMLDTLVECSWGLWLHDRHGNLTPERPFPGEAGDADFVVATARGELWIDCLSVEPTDRRSDISAYLASRVRNKWGKKFGARPSAASLPAAIAVTMLKGQEHVMPALILDEITKRRYEAPSSLWVDCPGLQEVWFGLPSWEAGAQRPDLMATWKRP